MASTSLTLIYFAFENHHFDVENCYIRLGLKVSIPSRWKTSRTFTMGFVKKLSTNSQKKKNIKTDNKSRLLWHGYFWITLLFNLDLFTRFFLLLFLLFEKIINVPNFNFVLLMYKFISLFYYSLLSFSHSGDCKFYGKHRLFHSFFFFFICELVKVNKSPIL